SGADLGTAWRQPNYNDGSWPSGPGVLGFPQNEALPAVGAAIQTILATNNGDTRIRTYYFRTHFTYTNSQTSGISLTASNLLDDGAVYYLNGVEVGRIAMPFGTTNDYQTGSTRADDISNHGVDVLILTPTNLVQGDNLLAVEVHQGGSASSDVVFGMTLIAPTAIAITDQPQSLSINEGLSASFTVGASGFPRFY